MLEEKVCPTFLSLLSGTITANKVLWKVMYLNSNSVIFLEDDCEEICRLGYSLPELPVRRASEMFVLPYSSLNFFLSLFSFVRPTRQREDATSWASPGIWPPSTRWPPSSSMSPAWPRPNAPLRSVGPGSAYEPFVKSTETKLLLYVERWCR